MRTALRKIDRMARMPSRKAKALPYSIPAPVGGWNARDSIDDMAEDEAVHLDNFFPGFGKCSLRNGHSSYATGLESEVFAIAELNGAGYRKCIAAANGKIWDVSSAGAGVSLKAGFANDKWQWAQFDDASGGARVGLVNGEDAPQIYTGVAVTAMTVSGTGLTVANLIGINVFKGRSYFWDGVSQDFWYSSVSALGGVLTKFPLGRVSGFGGNLTAMGTWSRDGGDGADDLAVFLMSSGDVVVYAGSNPGDSADWSLVGVYRIGAPLSVRSCIKVGADLIIITKDGYVPLSKVLASDRSRGEFAISDKIRGAVSEATQAYGANYGWQAIHYPRGNMALFNVPISSSIFHQHVVNTQTGAWCRFTGLNPRCMGLYNDRIYLGGSGVVYLGDDGTSDNGTSVRGDGQTAWSYFKRRGQQKRVTMARVLGRSTGELPYSLALGADFRSPSLAVSLSTAVIEGGDWDTSDWDTTDWPIETQITDSWASAGEIGYNFSARLRLESSTQGFDWYATGFLFEPGGLL